MPVACVLTTNSHNSYESVKIKYFNNNKKIINLIKITYEKIFKVKIILAVK